jgi:transcriptional regulator with XRE-family HTH domain
MKKSLYTPEQEILQDLLYQLRTAKRLSQADIAKRIEKSQSVVSKYESGERRLDVVELRAVCHAIGISLPDFISEFEKRLDD